jgi:hypothetical protein
MATRNPHFKQTKENVIQSTAEITKKSSLQDHQLDRKASESIDSRQPPQPVIRTNDGTYEEDVEEQAP